MGLLAKATAMREQWEQATKQTVNQTLKIEPKKPVQPLSTTKKLYHTKPVVKKHLKPLKVMRPVTKSTSHPKLRKLATALFLVGLTLNSKAAKNATSLNASSKQLNSMPQIELEIAQSDLEQALTAKIDRIFEQDFTHSVVSEAERDNLARLLYGEAGPDIHDKLEVLHTVFNRYASPLFKGTINDIITAKNQYIGYKPTHPVTPENRAIVDSAVDDWEKHGCQKVDGCNHYYFITGKQGHYNLFEESPEGSNGRWVNKDNKVYSQPEHSCVSTDRQVHNHELIQHYKTMRQQNSAKHQQPTQQLQPSHQLAHIHINDICMM